MKKELVKQQETWDKETNSLRSGNNKVLLGRTKRQRAINTKPVWLLSSGAKPKNTLQFLRRFKGSLSSSDFKHIVHVVVVFLFLQVCWDQEVRFFYGVVNELRVRVEE